MTTAAKLRKVYARIPRMESCRGACWRSCGPISFSGAERVRMELAARRVGRTLGRTEDGLCSLLTADGRCSIYNDRPAICRLWGTTPRMRCPAGCVPEFWLEEDEAQAIVAELLELSGGKDYTTGTHEDLVQLSVMHRRALLS